MNAQDYIPIIGLEIHVELKTKSKMFCGCDANYFGAKPNTHCCPVCLGLPGALPVPNRKAVEWCVLLGLALDCEIPQFAKFDRKNYFYSDLPKGYQISQYDKPFAVNGYLDINLNYSINQSTNQLINKRIRIRRVHMEEDTGKLMHTAINGVKCTLIDYNRSGVPLVEIVTEPDIRSSEEARMFLKKLYQIIRYLEISDADMEKGSMRLEPNISLIKISNYISQVPNKSEIRNPKSEIKNDDLPKYKVEVKNINSFSFVRKAIDYEIARQMEILEKGQIPKQETRGWDEKKGITYPQRSKEEAHDYRYFPEPDIPPIYWETGFAGNLRKSLPELPDQKISRFVKDYKLSEKDVLPIVEEKSTASFFDRCMEYAGKHKKYHSLSPKKIANYMINRKIIPGHQEISQFLDRISDSMKKIETDMTELEKAVGKIILQQTEAIKDYRKGKTQVMMFLIGLIMREMKGKADPVLVRGYIEKKLNINN